MMQFVLGSTTLPQTIIYMDKFLSSAFIFLRSNRTKFSTFSILIQTKLFFFR